MSNGLLPTVSNWQVVGTVTEHTQQQNELKQQQTELLNIVNTMNIKQPEIWENQPTTVYRGNIDWITHDDFEDMEMSAIQDSAISVAIGFLAGTTTISKAHKYKNLPMTAMSVKSITPNRFAKNTAGYHFLQLKCIAAGLLLVSFKQELAKSRNFFLVRFLFSVVLFLSKEIHPQ